MNRVPLRSNDGVRPLDPDMAMRIFGDQPYRDYVNGPARHVVIRPALPLWEILIMCAVAAFIGVLLATGGAL